MRGDNEHVKRNASIASQGRLCDVTRDFPASKNKKAFHRAIFFLVGMVKPSLLAKSRHGLFGSVIQISGTGGG